MVECAIPAAVMMNDSYSAIFYLVKGSMSPDYFIHEVERVVVIECMENE